MSTDQSSILFCADPTILCYQTRESALDDIIRDGVTYRVVPGWPKYRIGEDGTGWGHRGGRMRGYPGWIFWRKLRPQRHSGDYQQFHFYNSYDRKPMFVHRLVLETFVGPCPPGLEACHSDGDRTNNRLLNLRWDTKTNNHADKVIHGTLLKGSGIATSKLTEADIPVILEMTAAGLYQWQIAEKFGVEQTNICHVLNGRTWGHVSGLPFVPHVPRKRKRTVEGSLV